MPGVNAVPKLRSACSGVDAGRKWPTLSVGCNAVLCGLRRLLLGSATRTAQKQHTVQNGTAAENSKENPKRNARLIRKASKQDKRPDESKRLVADDNGSAVDATNGGMTHDPIRGGEADEGSSQKLDEKSLPNPSFAYGYPYFCRCKEQGDSGKEQGRSVKCEQFRSVFHARS